MLERLKIEFILNSVDIYADAIRKCCEHDDPMIVPNHIQSQVDADNNRFFDSEKAPFYLSKLLEVMKNSRVNKIPIDVWLSTQEEIKAKVSKLLSNYQRIERVLKDTYSFWAARYELKNPISEEERKKRIFFIGTGMRMGLYHMDALLCDKLLQKWAGPEFVKEIEDFNSMLYIDNYDEDLISLRLKDIVLNRQDDLKNLVDNDNFLDEYPADEYPFLVADELGIEPFLFERGEENQPV